MLNISLCQFYTIMWFIHLQPHRKMPSYKDKVSGLTDIIDARLLGTLLLPKPFTVGIISRDNLSI